MYKTWMIKACFFMENYVNCQEARADGYTKISQYVMKYGGKPFKF